MLAFYYVAGHAYGRPRPFAAIFFCEFGAFSCFVTLPDERLFALQIMFFATAVMQLYVGLLHDGQPAPAGEIDARFPGRARGRGTGRAGGERRGGAAEPELEDMGADDGGEEKFVEVTEEYLGSDDSENAENTAGEDGRTKEIG